MSASRNRWQDDEFGVGSERFMIAAQGAFIRKHGNIEQFVLLEIRLASGEFIAQCPAYVAYLGAAWQGKYDRRIAHLAKRAE
jgi:hypothetical protein